MKIQVKETQLNIEDRGNGQPLLLIHGFPLNLEMWRPQIEELSSSVRTIAVDLRGHGLSPPTPGPYPMELLADDCAAVLSALGVKEQVAVMGLSMGGYISFALYRRHPQLVSGLILASTRAGADSEQGKANREQAAAEVAQEGTQPMIERMLPILMSPKTYHQKPKLVQKVEGILTHTSPGGMVSALQGMKERPDSTGTLDQILVPTLILHGLDDQIIPLSEAETMQAGIPAARLVAIPDAGHLPNLEQAEIFNQAVASFLETVKFHNQPGKS